MTVLRAISLLAHVMGSEITCSKLLSVVVTASKDRVPNISSLMLQRSCNRLFL
ncbi:hypothetical protein HanPI659440_Chr12g0455441 [Helianthus annuus]|nr:hypothetical protein HanPI659440_Chr12g0455441 [Helianthus annuus]